MSRARHKVDCAIFWQEAMSTYRYRAVALNGGIIQGKLEAPTLAAAQAAIQAEGALLLSLTNADKMDWRAILSGELGSPQKLRPKVLAHTVGRMASLLEAGLPAETALAMLSSDSDSVVQRHVTELLQRLRGGCLLAEAMEADTGTFPPIAIAMVRAGEANGALAASLARLSNYLLKAEEVRQTIRSALIYPAILLLTATGSILLVLTVVLPQLEPVFAEVVTELPVLTRLAFALSDFIRTNWTMLAAITVLLSLFLQRFLVQPAMRLRCDRLLLRFPISGAFIRRSEAGRFCRTLGALLAGGISLPTALELAVPVLTNQEMIEVVRQVTTKVREGGMLATPLADTGLFPTLATQMIRIGESTGQLHTMLTRLADLLDADVRRAVERSLALLIPTLTIILGILVIGIITSVMLALLSINQLVQ